MSLSRRELFAGAAVSMTARAYTTIRGANERLVPVLMTASSAIVALIPLLFGGSDAGKEILHPVALVIFGGLISSTALDMMLTPLLFYRFAPKALEQLLAPRGAQVPAEAY